MPTHEAHCPFCRKKTPQFSHPVGTDGNKRLYVFCGLCGHCVKTLPLPDEK